MLVNSTILNTIKKQEQVLKKEQKLLGLNNKEFSVTEKLLEETYALTTSSVTKPYGQYIQEKETSSEITKNIFEAMQKIKNTNNLIQNNGLKKLSKFLDNLIKDNINELELTTAYFRDNYAAQDLLEKLGLAREYGYIYKNFDFDNDMPEFMDSILSNYFKDESDYEWIINELSDKLKLNDDEKNNLKTKVLKDYTPLILFKDIKNMQDFIDYIGYVDLKNDSNFNAIADNEKNTAIDCQNLETRKLINAFLFIASKDQSFNNLTPLEQQLFMMGNMGHSNNETRDRAAVIYNYLVKYSN